MHKLLKDLYKIRLDCKKLKKSIFKQKELYQKALNAEIDNVIKDNTVSVHRLRGNFANAIDEWLVIAGFKDYVGTDKKLLGHSENLKKDDIEDQVKT